MNQDESNSSMHHVKYISHNTFSEVEKIKLASLYFDRIDVAMYVRIFLLPEKRSLLTKNYFHESSFFDHLQPLAKAGIVRPSLDLYEKPRVEVIDIPPPHNVKGFRSATFDGPLKALSQIVFRNYDYIMSPKDGKMGEFTPNNFILLDGEYKDEANRLVGEVPKINPFTYYVHLLHVFLDNLSKGENCLTTSGILQNFILKYFSSKVFSDAKKQIERSLNVNPNIAMEALSLNVPNVSKLSCDDILDVRFKMNDELAAFKAYLQNLQIDLGNYNELELMAKAKEMVKVKINPAIDDLTNKLRGLRLNVPANILRELKDPKSYSPLLLSMTNNLSSTLAILLSLGLVTLTAAMDHFRESQNIKKNGLYYLLKLRGL